MKIIGLSGLAKAGKTTAAEAAAARLFDEGFTPVIEQFAKPLKEASAMMGFAKGGSYDHLYRKFCQFVGTDIVRAHEPDWWVKLMQARLHEYMVKETRLLNGESFHEYVVIIDDVRFPNELQLIRDNDGQSLFISARKRLQLTGQTIYDHESEQMAKQYENGELEDTLFDYTVSNNDPLGETAFAQTVASLVSQIVHTSLS